MPSFVPKFRTVVRNIPVPGPSLKEFAMSIAILLFLVVVVPAVGAVVAWWRRLSASLPRTNQDFGCW
jgi:hypothetical protein